MNIRKIGLIIVFTFILLLPSILAQNKVCCERTIEGEYCLYTDEAMCDSDSKMAATTCEQTSYCAVGCCYSTDEGTCYKSVPKAKCKAEENASWKEDPSCNVPQCVKGCCNLGTECFFVTLTKCKRETSKYQYANMSFNDQITTELECTNNCRSQEEGCCVQEDSCSFTTRDACPTQRETTTVLLTNTTDIGFHPNMLCSNQQLSCDCAKQHHTGCAPGKDEVYWFDSCGNKENIYSSDKTQSYKGGYVLSKAESCSLGGAYDPNCGNCYYPNSNLCMKDEEGIAKDGDYICADLSCRRTQGSPSTISGGTSKKNGESWCNYDGAVGFGQDLVGSRHYRSLCINGEEIPEACKDYREEMCIEDVLGQAPVPTTQAFGSRSGNYVEATCRENRWEECSSCNELESCGSDCGEYTGEEYQMCCRKLCCENYYLRDCYWLQAGISDLTAGKVSKDLAGTCVPHVPPGFKFWEAAVSQGDDSEDTSEISEDEPINSNSNKQTTQSGGGTDCSSASQSCEAKFERGGYAHLLGKGDWECIENCHCIEDDWVKAAAITCKSLGDCGAYYNFIGEGTMGGFTAGGNVEYKLKMGDLGDWSTISMVSKDKDSAYGIKQFWDQMWPFYLGTLGTTLAGGIFGAASKGSISGFGEGAKGALTYTPLEGAINAVFNKDQNLNTATQSSLSKKFGSSEFEEKDKIPKGTLFTEEAIKGTTGYKNVLEEELNKVDYTSIDSKRYNEVKNEVDKKMLEIVESYNKMNKDPMEEDDAQKTEKNLLASELKKEFATELKAKETTIFKEYIGSKTIEQAGKTDLYKLTEKAEGSNPFGLKGEETIESISPKGGTALTALASIAGLYNNIILVTSLLKGVEHINADETTRTYTITCETWQAPLGGDDCEKCNDPYKACSEYRCKSLGQSCKLVNEGTENETCINADPNDASSPILTVWPEAITKPYVYSETTDQGIPGYYITPEIESFTPVSIGFLTNEPAQCKYSLEHSTDFDEMTLDFGHGLFSYKHDMYFSLPSELKSKEALELSNGGTYTIYIRCIDGSGNKNDRDYFIRFSIKPGPDMTPPVIELSSIGNGAYFPYNTTETPLSIYTNEPADCKYSKEDKEYDKMNNTMSCSKSGFAVSSLYYGLYECKTTLKNLKEGTNDFYFRCRDQPNEVTEERNTNDESFTYSLIVSDTPLEITSVGPLGELYENSPTLKVITQGGINNGQAICAFSTIETEVIDSMILFETTDNTTTHQQPFNNLSSGEYNYYITCQDAAGNQDSIETSFTITVDTTPPKIKELYIDSSALHITMNEESNCEYSIEGPFNFGTGTPMTGIDSEDHEATLEDATYIVICEDKYDNQARYYIYP